MDFEQRYRAVSSRDERFDGTLYTAVTSTGIYCRPSRPAITPRRGNVRFYRTAAAAQAAGFRTCKRCLPGAVPGLARHLGYSERQVHRRLVAEVGAGPPALARAQRSHTARVLLERTDLPVTEIAFAAGFDSVRQFNATTPPGEIALRLAVRHPSALGELVLVGERDPGGDLRLTGLCLPDHRRRPAVDPASTEDRDAFAGIVAHLDACLAGERMTFEMPLDLRGTPFQRRVWADRGISVTASLPGSRGRPSVVAGDRAYSRIGAL